MATIYSVESREEESELYNLKTDVGNFTAHELFFALDKKELIGHEALIVADAQNNIIRAFSDHGQFVYEHNEDEYAAYMQQGDSYLQFATEGLSDPKAFKKARRRAESVRKIEQDEKIQSKYLAIKASAVARISEICGIRNLITPFSMADVERIAFAGACSLIVRNIKQIENYLGVRNIDSCFDEPKECFLWKTFTDYKKIGRYAERPMTYEDFLNALELLIRDKQYFPR